MLMFADIAFPFSLPHSWNGNGNTWEFVSVARFIFANPVVVRAVGQLRSKRHARAESDLLLNSGMVRCGWHVTNVPNADIESALVSLCRATDKTLNRGSTTPCKR